ncbi:MAG: hypothetical protein COA79_22225 [Planctomycetota bacterium]|nr:MAG: hypothetical protein COA79_22225 [Planctomycetota bacterium]
MKFLSLSAFFLFLVLGTLSSSDDSKKEKIGSKGTHISKKYFTKVYSPAFSIIATLRIINNKFYNDEIEMKTRKRKEVVKVKDQNGKVYNDDSYLEVIGPKKYVEEMDPIIRNFINRKIIDATFQINYKSATRMVIIKYLKNELPFKVFKPFSKKLQKKHNQSLLFSKLSSRNALIFICKKENLIDIKKEIHETLK